MQKGQAHTELQFHKPCYTNDQRRVFLVEQDFETPADSHAKPFITL